MPKIARKAFGGLEIKWSNDKQTWMLSSQFWSIPFESKRDARRMMEIVEAAERYGRNAVQSEIKTALGIQEVDSGFW